MRTKMSNAVDQPKIVDPEKEMDIMSDPEARSHMHTLLEAHQIMADPEKMKKVHALVGRHQKAVKSLKDLQNIYQKKYGGQTQQPKPSDEDGDE